MKKKYIEPILKKYNRLREITLRTCGAPHEDCTCIKYEYPVDPTPHGGCACYYNPPGGVTCD